MKGEEIETVDPADPPARVSVPLKAHLADGSVAVFADGATFAADTLRGAGDRYSLTLEPRMSVQSLPLDSVIAIETYRESVRTGSSIAASVLGTVLGTLGTTVLRLVPAQRCIRSQIRPPPIRASWKPNRFRTALLRCLRSAMSTCWRRSPMTAEP
jgi:hypothetical protein